MDTNIENTRIIFDIVIHSGYMICGILAGLCWIIFIIVKCINEIKFNSNIVNAKETAFLYLLMLIFLLILISGLIVCCYIIIRSDLIDIGILT